MSLRKIHSVKNMMESTVTSYPKSFNETHCAIDGEDIENLRNCEKETCSVCKKIFHYPKCWNQHKKETGHKNT